MEQNKTALITGASSGIGFELSKIFALNNYNLVLVANDREKLENAARELRKDNIKLVTISKDLSKHSAAGEIYDQLQQDKIVIDVLINNAGYATYGLFVDTDLPTELLQLEVNIVTLTNLTKLFARDMVKRGEGKILNVASTAAFLPGPLMAVYYASKAYVLSFSEALSNELAGTGVTMSVLCPGPTDTGFMKKAHLENSKLFQRKNMDASIVAKIAYQGLMKGKTIIIPNLRDRILIEGIRLVPRSIVSHIVRYLQEKNDS